MNIEENGVTKVASWNVNSLKVRLSQVIEWLSQTNTDVLALQETKCIDENFPVDSIRELGYEVCFSGQKTYNGVAIISKKPGTDVVTDIPNLDDPQRRIIAATIGNIRLINLYVPNGSTLESDKYQYKLDWLEKVHTFVENELKHHENLIVVGDFNIAPEDIDVHDPEEWEGQVLVSPPERNKLQDIMALGLYDAYRGMHPDEQAFTWWDYRAAGFRRNRGLRIDHIFVSLPLNQQLISCSIDRDMRKKERPSDHAPIMAELKI